MVILKVLDEKVAAMEEAAARLEEAARPLTEAEGLVGWSRYRLLVISIVFYYYCYYYYYHYYFILPNANTIPPHGSPCPASRNCSLPPKSVLSLKADLPRLLRRRMLFHRRHRSLVRSA